MTEEGREQVVLNRAVQVGVVVRDMDATMKILGEVFGIGPFRTVEWPTDRPDMKFYYKGEPGKLRMRLGFAKIGAFELELIQPLEGDSDYHHFLAAKGEGLHHILFDVENAEQIISSLGKRGIGVIQTGTGLRPGTRWAYLDTADSRLQHRTAQRRARVGRHESRSAGPAHRQRSLIVTARRPAR